jgi:regulator of protease activity HflC (stomatin/prohibitin superfamily)
VLSKSEEEVMAAKRNYRKEYDNYQGTEEQKKRRASRNAARKIMAEKGKVKKGDGKDVDHTTGNPMNNKKLAVKPKSVNRSFPRTSSARKKV